MKARKMILVLVALVFAITGNAQIVVNSEGNICAGNDSCFWGFDGAMANQYMSPRWTNVSSTTFNVGGALSIAAMEPYIPAFSISTPYKTTYGISISPVFYIDKNGAVYSRNSIVQSSDSTLKTNITVLTSTLSKIKRLKGVSYDFKNEDGGGNGQMESAPQRSLMKNDASSRHIGLLAQDVEKVYPEVVHLFNDSTKGIAYGDLVAVLIEGIKELNDSLTSVTSSMQEQIDRLQIQIENMQSANAPQQGKVSKNSSNNSNQTEPVLYQNTPNPFSQDSEIAYRLTSDAQSASIGIYDLNGRLLKQYPLNTHSTTGKVQVMASDFERGMYIYALVIDGNIIDSRRMLVEY